MASLGFAHAGLSSEQYQLNILRGIANDDAYYGKLLKPDLQEDIRRHLASIDAKTRSAPAPSGPQER